MKLHLHNTPKFNLIQSCKKTEHGFCIQIDHKTYEKSIVLSSTGVLELDIRTPDQLTEEHFQQFAATKPTICLLGTGESIVFPQGSLTKPLIENKIGLEVMANEAACRTHNILLADGRNVTTVILL